MVASDNLMVRIVIGVAGRPIISSDLNAIRLSRLSLPRPEALGQVSQSEQGAVKAQLSLQVCSYHVTEQSAW